MRLGWDGMGWLATFWLPLLPLASRPPFCKSQRVRYVPYALLNWMPPDVLARLVQIQETKTQEANFKGQGELLLDHRRRDVEEVIEFELARRCRTYKVLYPLLTCDADVDAPAGGVALEEEGGEGTLNIETESFQMMIFDAHRQKRSHANIVLATPNCAAGVPPSSPTRSIAAAVPRSSQLTMAYRTGMWCRINL